MPPNTDVTWVTPTATAQSSPQGERVGMRGTGWEQRLDEGRGRRGLWQRLRDDVSLLLLQKPFPFPTRGPGPEKPGAVSGAEGHLQTRH